MQLLLNLSEVVLSLSLNLTIKLGSKLPCYLNTNRLETEETGRCKRQFLMFSSLEIVIIKRTLEI